MWVRAVQAAEGVTTHEDLSANFRGPVQSLHVATASVSCVVLSSMVLNGCC
jgi:hypothetical protein